MSIDMTYTPSIKMESEFTKRENDILARIKVHYGKKLDREIQDEEAKEIADNLLNFAKVIYGT